MSARGMPAAAQARALRRTHAGSRRVRTRSARWTRPRERPEPPRGGRRPAARDGGDRGGPRPSPPPTIRESGRGSTSSGGRAVLVTEGSKAERQPNLTPAGRDTQLYTHTHTTGDSSRLHAAPVGRRAQPPRRLRAAHTTMISKLLRRRSTDEDRRADMGRVAQAAADRQGDLL